MSRATTITQIRAALTTAITATGTTTLQWPGDTQALPTPCWTIGVPEHDLTQTGGAICWDDWVIAWPVTHWAIQTNDQTSTLIIDQSVGDLLDTTAADPTLGGLVDDARVTRITHTITTPTPAGGVRLHEVRCLVITTSRTPT